MVLLLQRRPETHLESDDGPSGWERDGRSHATLLFKEEYWHDKGKGEARDEGDEQSKGTKD